MLQKRGKRRSKLIDLSNSLKITCINAIESCIIKNISQQCQETTFFLLFAFRFMVQGYS